MVVDVLMDAGTQYPRWAYIPRTLFNTAWHCVFLSSFTFIADFLWKPKLCLWVWILLYMFTNVLREGRSHASLLAIIFTIELGSVSKWLQNACVKNKIFNLHSFWLLGHIWMFAWKALCKVLLHCVPFQLTLRSFKILVHLQQDVENNYLRI